MDTERLLQPHAEGEEVRNYYKCRLTCLAERGKGRTLARIITGLTNCVDPYQQIVNVEENSASEKGKKGDKLPKVKVKGCLITPALSVMLYVREVGEMCVKDAEKILKKSPWSFHHKVELQKRSYPKTSLAKQEFYKLAPDLPLFAACPVLTGNEHLRISMYVHDFNAMVEFYRLITDTEIETQKPEFCIFQIYQQPGLDVQLSLKHSKYIFPIPIESAYVSFNVNNINVVKLGTNADVKHVNKNVYTTRDPDGNLVVLYEISRGFADAYSHFASNTGYITDNAISVDDLKSLKSTTESHDSGRYSDTEGTLADIVFADDKVHKSRARELTIVGETSDGYASSLVSLNSDAISDSGKGKSLKNGARVAKRSNTFTTAKTTDHARKSSDPNETIVAPVYI